MRFSQKGKHPRPHEGGAGLKTDKSAAGRCGAEGDLDVIRGRQQRRDDWEAKRQLRRERSLQGGAFQARGGGVKKRSPLNISVWGEEKTGWPDDSKEKVLWKAKEQRDSITAKEKKKEKKSSRGAFS